MHLGADQPQFLGDRGFDEARRGGVHRQVADDFGIEELRHSRDDQFAQTTRLNVASGLEVL